MNQAPPLPAVGADVPQNGCPTGYDPAPIVEPEIEVPQTKSSASAQASFSIAVTQTNPIE